MNGCVILKKAAQRAVNLAKLSRQIKTAHSRQEAQRKIPAIVGTGTRAQKHRPTHTCFKKEKVYTYLQLSETLEVVRDRTGRSRTGTFYRGVPTLLQKRRADHIHPIFQIPSTHKRQTHNALPLYFEKPNPRAKQAFKKRKSGSRYKQPLYLSG